MSLTWDPPRRGLSKEETGSFRDNTPDQRNLDMLIPLLACRFVRMLLFLVCRSMEHTNPSSDSLVGQCRSRVSVPETRLQCVYRVLLVVFISNE